MRNSGNGRLLIFSAVISTVIAGLFSAFTKSVPEGSLRSIVPYTVGTAVEAAPPRYCQVVRFWVPLEIVKSRTGLSLEQITDQLNLAVTGAFGGWTRWHVNGEWKDKVTQTVYKEDGYMYEVGLESCSDDDVTKLRDIARRFIKKEMEQLDLYFTATRFAAPTGRPQGPTRTTSEK